MKRIVSILLIFLYLTVLFIPLNPVINYVLHKKYYTEVLCENKDKPKMHCAGKCHLKKEIKKTEEKTNNPNKPIPITKSKIKTFPVFLDQINANKTIALKISQRQSLYNLPFFKDIYQDILTPPPKQIV